MRLLTFIADRFAWTPFSRTLDEAPDAAPGEATDALVAFVHVEPSDVDPQLRAKAFKKALKHLKWIANKRELKAIVLHSFGHLGGEMADAEQARRLLNELADRLAATGYAVSETPFGWFSSWSIDVRGESLAKVFKQI